MDNFWQSITLLIVGAVISSWRDGWKWIKGKTARSDVRIAVIHPSMHVVEQTDEVYGMPMIESRFWNVLIGFKNEGRAPDRLLLSGIGYDSPIINYSGTDENNQIKSVLIPPKDEVLEYIRFIIPREIEIPSRLYFKFREYSLTLQFSEQDQKMGQFATSAARRDVTHKLSSLKLFAQDEKIVWHKLPKQKERK